MWDVNIYSIWEILRMRFFMKVRKYINEKTMEGQKADSCIHETDFMIPSTLKGSAVKSFNNTIF